MKCKHCHSDMLILEHARDTNKYIAILKCPKCGQKAGKNQLNDSPVVWESDLIAQGKEELAKDKDNLTCDQCEGWFFGSCDDWNPYFHANKACDRIVLVEDELRDKLLNY